jgi:hypothetical protein
MTEQDDGRSASRFEITVPALATLLVTTAGILIGLVLLYIETGNMAPSMLEGYAGDAFYPRLVIGFTAVWAVIILARGFLLSRHAATRVAEPDFPLYWPELVWVAALVTAYALLVEPVGFEITTVVLMMALLVPRMLVVPGARLSGAMARAFALSAVSMLILYAGLGAGLKIGLPLLFLPVHFY